MGKTIHRRAALRTLGGGAAAALWPLAPGPAAPTRRPSVLWIMFDDGRADALGCYGRHWARTPHLDRIAAEGVRFEHAVVQGPVCIPSRTSMKTGLYCHQTGVMAMGDPATDPPRYLNRRVARPRDLLNVWREQGIAVHNVGKIHAFRPDFDTAADVPQGLNAVGQPTPKGGERWAKALRDPVFTTTHHWLIGGVLDLPAEETPTWRLGDLAVDRLRPLAESEDPFFFRLSFHDPHVPCAVPEPYLSDPATIALPLATADELAAKPRWERTNLQTYAGADLSAEQIALARATSYGMVSLADVQVGRVLDLLERAGRLDDTIVVVNSDQGFQLGEHGQWKKRNFYDTNVLAPLLFRHPGTLPAGRVITPPVEMLGLMPTLLDLAGLPAASAIAGRSLRPLIEGREEPRMTVFGEHDHSQDMYDELRTGGRRVMVRTEDWKLVEFMDARVPDRDGALYNLRTDPGERWNLWSDPDYRELLVALRNRAAKWDPSTSLT